MSVLRAGSTGEQVKRLQTALNRAGSCLVVDGVFGKDTETAVRKFQKEHGLQVDGVVGEQTWYQLYEVKPNNNQLYNAFITCLDAIEDLPEYKTLVEMLGR